MLDRFFEEDFRKRYTLIAAADIDGFVESACQLVERERDKNDIDVNRGTVDTERFERYVENYLVPVLGRFVDDEPRSIVVMDNASIHISERVRDLIEGAGAKLIYTAPYSPELNPIEFMFSVYKAGLKRRTGQGTGWLAAHVLSLFNIMPKKKRGRSSGKLWFQK